MEFQSRNKTFCGIWRTNSKDNYKEKRSTKSQENSRSPRKCLTLPVPWCQAALFNSQPFLPLSLELLLLLTSVHLWLSNFSCCPFCSISDIHPWRVHMCQTSPAHNLILYSIFFYWTPTKCWDEQSELTIPLCFPMYFQLRVWEPCFPWMFPRVLAFISPISLPKLYIKHLPAMRRPGFDPWVGKIPWRRK